MGSNLTLILMMEGLKDNTGKARRFPAGPARRRHRKKRVPGIPDTPFSVSNFLSVLRGYTLNKIGKSRKPAEMMTM
jgi:hypothetical protein